VTEANADDVVLWEFSNIDTTDGSCDSGDLCDEDLGLTFNQPSLVRLADSNGIVGNNANDNPWVVVLGNGYNNTGSGKAALFVLNVADGSVRRKFFDDPSTTSDDHCLPDADNGLSTPSVVDIDADTLADFIYAGDLKGNLWKFDIRNPTASNWTCEKLFVAEDSDGNSQPITAAPEVVLHPKKNPGTNTSDPTDDESTLMILFGTGRYLGASDVTNTASQTFYGVWDDGESVLTALTRSNLQEQIFCEAGNPEDEPSCETLNAEGDTITSAGEFTDGGRTFRVSSARSVNYVFGDATAPRGWFLDLSLNAGERVVGESVVVGGRILFTSIQPNPDECAFGGTSWLNILDPISGARPKESFLRCCGTDTDGQLIKETETGFPPSSVEIVGIASAPNIMKAPDLPEGAKFNAYLSTSEGIVEHVSIAGSELGRQSWRQLEFQ
jgi:type IV pilus assembly protein PilY1